MTNPLETVGSILTMSEYGSGRDLLPFYSAREITQTIKPADNSKNQRETINGQTVDLSLSKFKKYDSRISGRTVRPPALDKVFPGTIVLVGCVFLSSYATSGGTPGRPVVLGSSFTENGWTFYHPSMRFMIRDLSNGFAEWEADNDWFIDLREVSSVY